MSPLADSQGDVLSRAQALADEVAPQAGYFDRELVQGLVADSVVKVSAARELCRRAGRLRQANDMDAVMETKAAKYFTSTAARDVTDVAVQVLGGNGCWNECPAERLFREAKVLEII